jgi:hypothetical protein
VRHYDADVSRGMKRKVRAMQFLVTAKMRPDETTLSYPSAASQTSSEHDLAAQQAA